MDKPIARNLEDARKFFLENSRGSIVCIDGDRKQEAWVFSSAESFFGKKLDEVTDVMIKAEIENVLTPQTFFNLEVYYINSKSYLFIHKKTYKLVAETETNYIFEDANENQT